MKRHLKYGGSTAERTLACPAWADRAEAMVFEGSGTGSVYANEGTLLHDAMEQHYRDNTPFAEMVGQLSYAGIVLTAEHVERMLMPSVRMVETVMDQHDIEQYMCEPFVQLIPDLAGGSIDLLGLSADGATVLVLDYKMGSKRVHAEGNSQLQFYALCAGVDPLTRPFFRRARRVVYAVVQPKCSPQADTWVQHVDDLQPFHQRLLSAMYDQPKPARAGAHCYFCPVIACPERRQKAWEATVEQMDAPADIKHAVARERVTKNLLKLVDASSTTR